MIYSKQRIRLILSLLAVMIIMLCAGGTIFAQENQTNDNIPSLTITADKTDLSPNDTNNTATVTVTLTNASDYFLNDVTITSALPGNLELVSDSGSLTENVTLIGVGQTKSYSFTVKAKSEGSSPADSQDSTSSQTGTEGQDSQDTAPASDYSGELSLNVGGQPTKITANAHINYSTYLDFPMDGNAVADDASSFKLDVHLDTTTFKDDLGTVEGVNQHLRLSEPAMSNVTLSSASLSDDKKTLHLAFSGKIDNAESYALLTFDDQSLTNVYESQYLILDIIAPDPFLDMNKLTVTTNGDNNVLSVPFDLDTAQFTDNVKTENFIFVDYDLNPIIGAVVTDVQKKSDDEGIVSVTIPGKTANEIADTLDDGALKIDGSSINCDVLYLDFILPVFEPNLLTSIEGKPTIVNNGDGTATITAVYREKMVLTSGGMETTSGAMDLTKSAIKAESFNDNIKVEQISNDSIHTSSDDSSNTFLMTLSTKVAIPVGEDEDVPIYGETTQNSANTPVSSTSTPNKTSGNPKTGSTETGLMFAALFFIGSAAFILFLRKKRKASKILALILVFAISVNMLSFFPVKAQTNTAPETVAEVLAAEVSQDTESNQQTTKDNEQNADQKTDLNVADYANLIDELPAGVSISFEDGSVKDTFGFVIPAKDIIPLSVGTGILNVSGDNIMTQAWWKSVLKGIAATALIVGGALTANPMLVVGGISLAVNTVGDIISDATDTSGKDRKEASKKYAEAVQALKKVLDAGFATANRHVDAINNKIDRLNKKLDKIEGKVDSGADYQKYTRMAAANRNFRSELNQLDSMISTAGVSNSELKSYVLDATDAHAKGQTKKQNKALYNLCRSVDMQGGMPKLLKEIQEVGDDIKSGGDAGTNIFTNYDNFCDQTCNWNTLTLESKSYYRIKVMQTYNNAVIIATFYNNYYMDDPHGYYQRNDQAYNKNTYKAQMEKMAAQVADISKILKKDVLLNQLAKGENPEEFTTITNTVTKKQLGCGAFSTILQKGDLKSDTVKTTENDFKSHFGDVTRESSYIALMKGRLMFFKRYESLQDEMKAAGFKMPNEKDLVVIANGHVGTKNKDVFTPESLKFTGYNFKTGQAVPNMEFKKQPITWFKPNQN